MSQPHTEPTIGRSVHYRGKDGKTRAAIITAVHGTFCVNLSVFGSDQFDLEHGAKDSVTHGDPIDEPGCFPSWSWMPFQKGQIQKTEAAEAALKAPSGAPSACRVTPDHIAAVMSRATVKVTKLGDKTCCVHVTLKNGYEITEVAACVDPANYNEDVGKKIALKRIEDKLWQLEGWSLACRTTGSP